MGGAARAVVAGCTQLGFSKILKYLGRNPQKLDALSIAGKILLLKPPPSSASPPYDHCRQHPYRRFDSRTLLRWNARRPQLKVRWRPKSWLELKILCGGLRFDLYPPAPPVF